MTSRGRHFVQLEVDGLEAATKVLEGAGKSIGRAVPKALRRFADELKTRTEALGASLGSVHGHAVKLGGVAVFVRSGGSGIKLSAAKSPAILGAEYGAKQFAQFPAWRGNQFSPSKGAGVGYMMHPAMRAYLPKAEDELLKRISKAIEGEGL